MRNSRQNLFHVPKTPLAFVTVIFTSFKWYCRLFKCLREYANSNVSKSKSSKINFVLTGTYVRSFLRRRYMHIVEMNHM